MSLISGDKKGIVILWNNKLQMERQFSIPSITDNPTVVSLSALN